MKTQVEVRILARLMCGLVLLMTGASACGSGQPGPATATAASNAKPTCNAETQDLTLTGSIADRITCLHFSGFPLGSTFVCESALFQAGGETNLKLTLVMPPFKTAGPVDADQFDIFLSQSGLAKQWASGSVNSSLIVDAAEPAYRGSLDADLRRNSGQATGVVHMIGRWTCAKR